MLTVRLDQFSSLDAFARGYRQHVTRTTIYLPTRVPRAAGSMLLFRIELADGSCAFRGEGSVESFRHTPGGEQLGLTLRMRRLDKTSKELHATAFASVLESTAAAPPPPTATGGLASLADALGAAAEEALDALTRHPTAVDLAALQADQSVISRTEDNAPIRIRDDLRPAPRPVQEPVERPAEATVPEESDSDPSEQSQALGRMAVARLSVDEYEARKAAIAKGSAPPPVASLIATSESTAAWSEADDALDFEGIGSDIRENPPQLTPPAAATISQEDEPLPPAPTLPPLEGIVVAPPEEAVGGGVTLDEVTFAGASAYEMPKSAPLDPRQELDLDFDFTAVSFGTETSASQALSGSRPSAVSAAPAVVPASPAAAAPPSTQPKSPETTAVESAAPVAGAASPVAPSPSRLPPPPPPKGGAPLPGSGTSGARPAVPMSKPVAKPSAPEPEQKPGLFGWLRGKK